MPAPHRLRRRRTKGWRKPAGAVNCTRPGRFGNSYRIGDIAFDPDGEPDDCPQRITTPQQAARLFARDLRQRLRAGDPELREKLDELRGRDLMCWCSLCAPCHVDVWLVLANAPRCEAV